MTMQETKDKNADEIIDDDLYPISLCGGLDAMALKEIQNSGISVGL